MTLSFNDVLCKEMVKLEGEVWIILEESIIFQ